MSNAVYPILPGLAIEATKEPEFSTLVNRSVSGKELRIGERVYPLWYHTLKYNFLRDISAYPELADLGGFFLLRNGALDSFLFQDQDDYQVSGQLIGEGNGSATDFQAVRSFGSFTEPVFNVDVFTSAEVNGTPAAATLLPNGVIRFTSAPANGATLSWTGTYLYRSRFANDKMSLQRFMAQLWELGTVNLISSLQDKI